MLFVPKQSATFWTYDNWGTNPAATIGTSVVPGASNSEGSWTQIASSANIANDVHGFHLLIHSGATSTAVKSHLIDVGVDPAGGTSYTAVINNLVCGASPAITAAGGKEHYFPLYIKAGSSVAVRIFGENATAGTVRVAAKFFGYLSAPETYRVGSFTQTLGSISNARGQTFTPGNAANGAWADLGATTNDLWWWQLGYQLSNSNITAEYTYIDLAYGDASNKQIIFRTMHAGTTGETAGFADSTQIMGLSAYCPVKSGTNIYIRGRCNNAPDTDYNATVVGVGG